MQWTAGQAIVTVSISCVAWDLEILIPCQAPILEFNHEHQLITYVHSTHESISQELVVAPFDDIVRSA